VYSYSPMIQGHWQNQSNHPSCTLPTSLHKIKSLVSHAEPVTVTYLPVGVQVVVVVEVVAIIVPALV
jgi:hypothetical protein